MSEHEAIRTLLPLAAAGALGAEEQRGLESHLRDCNLCAAELQTYQLIGQALARTPLPPLPERLLERTRARILRQEAARFERRWSDMILACLMLFGWTVTLTVWLLWRVMTGGGGLLDFSLRSMAMWLGGTTLLAWLTAGAAAILLGPGRGLVRRYL